MGLGNAHRYMYIYVLGNIFRNSHSPNIGIIGDIGIVGIIDKY